jgi:NAD(P)-dependent dehydrogenase (short-subunit alcohol dehydrogenase family)
LATEIFPIHVFSTDASTTDEAAANDVQRVVITGAAHGLGAALARRFARTGAAVALLDVDGEGAVAQAEALAAGGSEALGLACDVTSTDDCRRAIDTVTRSWGGVDLLVNNAGITHLGRIEDTDVEVLRRVLEVNFFGAVNCTLAAFPQLMASRGRVVAISSVAGFAPLATRAGYVASKHALEGFFDTLRSEHSGDGLRVTLVCPSFVRTGIGDRALGPDGRPAAAPRSGVAHELEPQAAAELIFRGIEAGKRLVWVGREARISWWVAHLAPRIYERLMLRRVLD